MINSINCGNEVMHGSYGFTSFILGGCEMAEHLV